MSDDLLLGNMIPQVSALVSTGRWNNDLQRLGSVAQKEPGKMSDRELRQVANDFESILIRQLLKEMRKTIPKDGFLGASHATEMYQEMGDDALAKQLAETGGFGLGEIVYQELKEKQDHLHTAESIEQKKSEFMKLRRCPGQPDPKEFIPLYKNQDPAANAIPLHPEHKSIPMPKKHFLHFEKPTIPLDKVERR